LNVEREFEQLLNTLFLNLNDSNTSRDIDFVIMSAEQVYNSVELNLKEAEFEQVVICMEYCNQVDFGYSRNLNEKLVRIHGDLILDRIKKYNKYKVSKHILYYTNQLFYHLILKFSRKKRLEGDDKQFFSFSK
jgi:hypothetical protein